MTELTFDFGSEWVKRQNEELIMACLRERKSKSCDQNCMTGRLILKLKELKVETTLHDSWFESGSDGVKVN